MTSVVVLLARSGQRPETPLTPHRTQGSALQPPPSPLQDVNGAKVEKAWCHRLKPLITNFPGFPDLRATCSQLFIRSVQARAARGCLCEGKCLPVKHWQLVGASESPHLLPDSSLSRLKREMIHLKEHLNNTILSFSKIISG